MDEAEADVLAYIAHSVDRDQPIRPNVITESGDRDHALAGAIGGKWRAAMSGSGRCH